MYNQEIKKSLQLERGSKKTRRFKPDARCEELNMIVEFDGVQHYQLIKNVINDPIRDEYFSSLGYKVVRIPYFIQLSKVNIEHLFNVAMEDEMCPLKYSFYDSDEDGLYISPGSMCSLGVERFSHYFMSLPRETKNEIVVDLLLVSTKHPIDWVVPHEYQEKILRAW